MQTNESEASTVDDFLHLLASGSHRTRPEADVDTVLDRLLAMGATSSVLLLVDYEHRCLRPAPGRSCDEIKEPTEIEGSLVGRCFSTQALISVEGEAGWRIVVPVAERSDRLGVLDVTVPGDRKDLDPSLRNAASALAFLVVSGNRYTDRFRVARRRQEMTLPAEIQWGILPALAFKTEDVSIAGQLEPAYEVGGDVFDYALNGDILEVAILDGMGHGIEASILTNLALNAYRHGRTLGRDLVAQRHELDRLLRTEFGHGRFVTGVLGELHLPTGEFRWVNAGHPLPLILRDRHVIGDLALRPALPMGLGWSRCDVGSYLLEPGDLILLFTDGVTDARGPDGDRLGDHGLRDFLEREAASEQLTNEALRRLTAFLVEMAVDGSLRDDATLLLLKWGNPG